MSALGDLQFSSDRVADFGASLCSVHIGHRDAAHQSVANAIVMVITNMLSILSNLLSGDTFRNFIVGVHAKNAMPMQQIKRGWPIA
jgi:hypothetical protein